MLLKGPTLLEEDSVVSTIELPKILHFIWIGGPIPCKYLDNLLKLSEVAKRSDFELNLWVDDKENFFSTLRSNLNQDVELPSDEVLGIKLRMIESLKEGMESDPFYQNSIKVTARIRNSMGNSEDAEIEINPLNYFWHCVNIERCGLKNLASASDWLRYEIIRQKGGYYFDTDTEFLNLNSESRLIVDSPPSGFKACVNLAYSIWEDRVTYRNTTGGNDIIAALPNHPIIEQTIRIAMQNYVEMEMSTKHDLPASMDCKRFGSRRHLTLCSSGPMALCKAITNVSKAFIEQPIGMSAMQKLANIKSICISDRELADKSFMGVEIVRLFDGTWLKKAAKGKITSFDDFDLLRFSPMHKSHAAQPYRPYIESLESAEAQGHSLDKGKRKLRK